MTAGKRKQTHYKCESEKVVCEDCHATICVHGNCACPDIRRCYCGKRKPSSYYDPEALNNLKHNG